MKNAATNQFTGGLVMDLNPLVTPNNVLTDALNATLITNNGNESVLQNDMGNGRVETAYLPEGYIPVGSCEFGDIIYIASYNPLINKCQLGCFPSPQRNISSSSVSDLHQNLKASDFQVLDKNNRATGELIANSTKKIVYQNNLTAGDKYIIAGNNLNDYGKHLTDLYNTGHIKNDFPKLYKATLVSIEEDGKITELTNGLKWYENNYFIKDGQFDRTSEEGIDIDEWRSAVNSAWCIFSSKVSGKLAIIVELESISGFSCTWGVTVNKKENQEIIEGYQGTLQDYNIYFSVNWETENNNINPAGIVLTKGKWVLDDTTILLYRYNSNSLSLEDADKYDVSNQNINIAFLPDSEYYHSEFNRHYEPENFNGSYTDFKNEFEYNTYLTNKFNSIKNAKNQPAYNYDTEFSSIVRAEEDGWYYLNAKTSNLIYQDEEQIRVYYSDQNIPINAVDLTDDIVNNTFKYPIRKDFRSFTLPIEQNITIINDVKKELDLSKCIYEYEVAPYMPYGILREFAQSGTIDFSKIGKKIINLNTWKYYNQEGYCTLTWGLEAYTEPEHVIEEVVLEFFDDKGKAAALHISNKDSYNGVFTNYITFGLKSNYGLNNIGYNGNQFTHRGITLNESDLYVGRQYCKYNKEKNTMSIPYLVTADLNGNPLFEKLENGEEYCEDDSGILYSNLLYLVKINIKYSKIGPLGQLEYVSTKEDYRWLWTTTLFNEKYFNVQDFKEEQFELILDPVAKFETTTKWGTITDDTTFVEKSLNEEVISDAPESFSAIKQTVDSKGSPNVKIIVNATFQNTHNNIYTLKNSNPAQDNGINTTIYLGNEFVSDSPEQPEVKFSNNSDEIYDGIYPNNVIGGSDEDLGGVAFKQLIEEKPNSLSLKKEQYRNRFNLDFISDYTITDTFNHNDQGYDRENKTYTSLNTEITYKLNNILISNQILFECGQKDQFLEWENPFNCESINIKGAIKGVRGQLLVKKDDTFDVISEFNDLNEKLIDISEYAEGSIFRIIFPDIETYDKGGSFGITELTFNILPENVENIENDFEYLNSNYEEQTLNAKYIKQSLIKSSNKGFNLKFFGEHYSKYYYTTSLKYINAKVLKTFINSDSDYGYYNLSEKEGEGFLSFISIAQDNDPSKKTEVGLDIFEIDYNTSPKGESDNFYTTNFTPNRYTSDEANTSISKLWEKKGENIYSYYSFIFPVVWANSIESNKTESKHVAKYDNDKWLSYGTIVNKKEIRPSRLVGTCACIDVNNTFNIADQVKFGKHVYSSRPESENEILQKDTAIIYYGLRTKSFLENSFYVSGYEPKDIYVPNNWIYLNTNYSQYNRDVVIKVGFNNSSNKSMNDCILFNGIDYSNYLHTLLYNKNNGPFKSELIVDREPQIIVPTKIINSPNVRLNLKDCLKTFPFIIQFQYLKPTIDNSYKTNYYLIETNNKDIEEKIDTYLRENEDLEIPNDKIYCLHYKPVYGNDKSFKKQYISELNEDCQFLTKEEYFNLSNDFISKLSIKNGRILLDSKLKSLGTYSVRTDNGTKKANITQVPKNVLIFKDSKLEKDFKPTTEQI